MSEEERKLLVQLALVWNGYLALPDHHPSDVSEFQQGIHRLQEKVMARATRRAHPDFFN